MYINSNILSTQAFWSDKDQKFIPLNPPKYIQQNELDIDYNNYYSNYANMLSTTEVANQSPVEKETNKIEQALITRPSSVLESLRFSSYAYEQKSDLKQVKSNRARKFKEPSIDERNHRMSTIKLDIFIPSSTASPVLPDIDNESNRCSSEASSSYNKLFLFLKPNNFRNFRYVVNLTVS